MGVISAEYLVFSVNLTAHGSLRPTLNRSDHRKLNFVSVTVLVVTVKPKITCWSDKKRPKSQGNAERVHCVKIQPQIRFT